MGGEEEQGFIIRDRRGRAEQDAGSAAAQARPSASSTAPSSGQAQQAQSAPTQEPGMPVTFSSFVISVGTSALMLLGEQIDPQQPPVPVNLPQAKEIIDLLSVLEEKTRSNLTTEEQTVLRDMLYALRMKYVSLASGQPSSRQS